MGLTASQIVLRHQGIGSSDVAALLGEDAFKSPIDVWLDKTGRSTNTESLQTRMGNRAEQIVADEFAEKYGVELARCTTVVDQDRPWILATPDRRIVGRDPLELLECKRVGYRMLGRWRTGNRDEEYTAPPYVVIQATWQAMVMRARGTWVAADLGARDWYDRFIEFDSELAEGLVVVAERFWQDAVLANRPPDPGASAKEKAYLQRRYAQTSGALLESNDIVEALANDYARSQRAECKAKKAKEAAGNRLRAVLGDHVACAGEWGRVTWQAAKGGKTAWKEVAKAAGATAKQIAANTSPPARTLRVKVYELEEENDDSSTEEAES